MKIRDAKQAYSAQLNTLQAQRLTLRKTLQEQKENPTVGQHFDTVELSRELSILDAQYEATQQGMESIMAQENMVHDAEVARQQGDAMADAYKDMAKIMEVYRRIASGARVPAKDEQKLMEYSSELYMAAKNMALLQKRNDKEYDSLWEDKEDSEEEMSPEEIAGDTEISVAAPEAVAEAAAQSASVDVQA